jgi:hypothetical protein
MRNTLHHLYDGWVDENGDEDYMLRYGILV